MMTRIKHSLADQDPGMHRKNNQMGLCYWLTGLPGAGKTTIAVRIASADIRSASSTATICVAA
jgi:adenylylsulfate kinase-like enzyme